MRCQKHNVEMQIYSPPAVNGVVPMIALFRCPKCDAEREERLALEALQEANGLSPKEGE